MIGAGTMVMGGVVKLVNQVSGPAMKMAADTRVLKGAIRSADADTLALGRSLRTSGAAMMKTGGIATVAGAAILGGLGMLTKPAQGVEDALAKVRTTYAGMGETGTRELARLKNSALEWSKVHTDTAADYINATYIMRGAGLAMNTSIAGTESTLRLAKGTYGETTGAANLLAMTYKNFADVTKPVNEEMERFADILAVTQTRFQFENLDALTAGMEYIASAAGIAQAPIEGMATALGVLNSAGIQGERAGTGLRNVLLRTDKIFTDLGWTVPRTADGMWDLGGVIDMLGKNFDTSTQAGRAMLTELYGVRTMPVIAALINEGSDSLRRMTGEMGNLGGAAARMQATVEDTFGERWQRFKNNVMALTITIGEALMPHLEKLIGWLQGVIEGIGEWFKVNRKLVDTIGGILVGLGAVLAVGGPIIIAFGALKWIVGALATAFIALKLAVIGVSTAIKNIPVIGWILAIVAAVIAAIVLLIEHWDAVKAAIISAWHAVVDAFSWLYSGVKDVLKWVWDTVTGFFIGIWEWIKGLATRFYEAGKALIRAIGQGIADAASWLWDQITGVFGWIADSLLPHSDARTGPFSQLTAAGEAIPKTLADGVKKGTPGFLKAIKTTAVTAVATFKEAMAALPAELAAISPATARGFTRGALTYGLAGFFEKQGLGPGAAGVAARLHAGRFIPALAGAGAGAGGFEIPEDDFGDYGGGGGGGGAMKDRAGTRIFQLAEGALQITVVAPDAETAGDRVVERIDEYFAEEAAAHGG